MAKPPIRTSVATKRAETSKASKAAAKPRSTKPKASGRPSTYDPRYPEMCERLSFLGQTNRQMAEAMGISEETFYQWSRKHPKFAEAIERGRDPANANVARSLYERAVGAKVREQQLVMKTVRNEAGKVIGQEPTVITLTKEFPPETAAAMAWLTNRNPERWRNKQDHEVNLNMVVRRALLELPEE